MTWRLYIIPIVDGSDGKHRGPAYLGWTYAAAPVIPRVDVAVMSFGTEPWALVAANTTNAQNNTLRANADVMVLPANLDSTLNAAAVTTTQTFLEGINVPTDWLDTSYTYRQVLRLVIGLFQFAQRYCSIAGIRVFPTGSGVTLATQFSDLPAQARANLLAVANEFNYDISSLSASSTIRQILIAMARQWSQASVVMGGITI